MAAESPDKTVANPTEKRPPTGTRFPTETKCQRPDPAASRQFSSRLNIFAACLAFCTAVILGLATVMRCKYNSVLLGFCRRTEPDSGSGMLWIPPAERPVPLAAFRSLSTFGFTPKRNNPSEINPTNSNTNRNNPNRNSPNRNNPSRNLFKPFLRSAPGEEPVDGNADKTLHEDSPILLFMHVWKCAGSSLRCLLREWAELEEQKIAIVVTCTDVVSEVWRHAYFEGLGGEGALHCSFRMIPTHVFVAWCVYVSDGEEINLVAATRSRHGTLQAPRTYRPCTACKSIHKTHRSWKIAVCRSVTTLDP